MIQSTRTPGAATAPALSALQCAQSLIYLSGGSQTDVYRTADRRFVIKLKATNARTVAARQQAAQLQQVADLLRAHLGPEHSLNTWFLVLADDSGQQLVVGVQPFLDGAHPLDAVVLGSLTRASQVSLLENLRSIVRRSLACYHSTGRAADLYGYGRTAGSEARRWDPRRLLAEGWRLISQRPLLTAHNLMLTQDGRVVVVDYDPICHSRLSCRLIYGARALLLVRDQLQLGVACMRLHQSHCCNSAV